MGYKPAEPVQGKPLAQLVFEERLKLAETALQQSEVAVFDTIIELISRDIQALPEESISVREKWKEKRSLSQPEILKAFSPATRCPSPPGDRTANAVAQHSRRPSMRSRLIC